MSRRGRRIGVLGGAFDPPHIGHIVIAQEVRWRLGLDELLLIPVGEPPDRVGLAFDATTRARMVERAVDGYPGVRCSRIEVDRPGPSFTIDTLEAIADGEPGAEIWFALGADRLPTFPRWHLPHRILELARLAVVSRSGMSEGDLTALAERIAPGRWDVVEVPTIGVSSTMIRERIATGAPFEALVPSGVSEILRERA